MPIDYGSLDVTTSGAGTFSAIVMPSGVPSSTTNALYNDGGTIKFNGSEISADLSQVAEDMLPLFDGVFDVGSLDNRWYDVFVENSIDISGVAVTASDGSIVVGGDLVAGSLLVDNVLISDNLITPDDSTAREYLGNKGILVVNGNLDVQGDWIKVAVTGSYETNTGEFEPGVWSSGGNLITVRTFHAGAGTQDAALAIGGEGYSGGGSYLGRLASTEEYDGTSWSSGGNLITARYKLYGVGTQDAALAFGGRDSSNNVISSTEEYNGTSWSSGGNLITARYELGGAGIQDAALAFGGFGGGGKLASTEEYDGTSWSSGGNLSTTRSAPSGAGTQDAALSIGAYEQLSITEEYDGTSWSASANLNSGRHNTATAGTQDAALAAGGSGTGGYEIRSVEEYDGTSWTIAARLPEAKSAAPTNTGTQDAALVFGGYDSFSTTSSTYEYNKLPIIISTTPPTEGEEGQIRYNNDISDYQKYVNGEWVNWDTVNTVESVYGPTVWSFGGNLITARSLLTGAGTQDAGLAFGGNNGSALASTEEYNGASWSSGGNLNTAKYDLAGAGTQDAGLAFGGNNGSALASTEEYDGTSWSAGGNLNTARSDLAGAGTQDAGLAFGGTNPTTLSSTEEYDGTSWSAGGNLNTARYGFAGAGTQNAGLAFGGNTGLLVISSTEEYDGTSWSAGGNLISTRVWHTGAGTQNAALAFSGDSILMTEEYDGTSWSSTVKINQSRFYSGGAGTQDAALLFGGFDDGSILSSTEEYNTPTLSVPNDSGSQGELRFNKDNLVFEGYNSTEWQTLNGLVSNPSLVPNSIALTNVVVISQADYDALESYSETTLYVITD